MPRTRSGDCPWPTYPRSVFAAIAQRRFRYGLTPCAVPASEGAGEKSAEGFTINFAKSNKTAEWTSAAGSILDFAEENDVDIDFGCRAGNCGTCITAVKDGDVDYLTEPGERPEAGSCLACVSIPKGNITIDA